jgi:hypothetical protein
MTTLPEYTQVGEQLGVVVTRADGRVERDIVPTLKDIVRIVLRAVIQIRNDRAARSKPGQSELT